MPKVHLEEQHFNWIHFNYEHIFGIPEFETFDKYGSTVKEAVKNVCWKLIQTQSLITGLNTDSLTTVGILKTPLLTLPFSCSRRNRELFERKHYEDTCFIGIRPVYIKTLDDKYLSAESNYYVKLMSKNFISPDEVQWVIEFTGDNKVCLSRNDKRKSDYLLGLNAYSEVRWDTSRSHTPRSEFEIEYFEEENAIILHLLKSSKVLPSVRCKWKSRCDRKAGFFQKYTLAN